MSDLFISEILVLSLLLPVLLRPFFRRLQRIEGIALLPLLSALLCLAVIAGTGIRLGFLPVLLFAGLVFLSGIARMIRLFMGLPTDWFSPLSSVYSGILLTVFLGVLASAFFFAPEDQFPAGPRVGRTTAVEPVSPGISARYTVFSIADRGNPKPDAVVILLGDVSAGSGGRGTTARILAENGYAVVEADYTTVKDYGNVLLSRPALRKIIALAGKIAGKGYLLATDEEVLQTQSKELLRLVSLSRRQFGGDVPLFAVAEGSGSKALLARMKAEPSLFTGAVCIVPEDFSGSFSAVPGGYRTVTLDSGALPVDAGTVPVLALTGDAKYLPGYGELGADDVLAALLLGAERDRGRRIAELTGRRVASWIGMRRSHENR